MTVFFLMINFLSSFCLHIIHLGYAQTFEEAYERIENLYKEEEAGVVHENPPVEDFLVWRDLRVFDGKSSLSLVLYCLIYHPQHFEEIPFFIKRCASERLILNLSCSITFYFIYRDPLVLVVH